LGAWSKEEEGSEGVEGSSGRSRDRDRTAFRAGSWVEARRETVVSLEIWVLLVAVVRKEKYPTGQMIAGPPPPMPARRAVLAPVTRGEGRATTATPRLLPLTGALGLRGLCSL
jgi:hypothetical protein